jgi:hypothetical protein
MPKTRTSIPNSNQQTSTVNDRLEKRLLAYMAAAGAAGVSVLAMTQPANAKVVYTPANRAVTWHGNDYLDLNNDGIPDFGFQVSGLGNHISYFVGAFKINRIMSNGLPLAAGVSVGPSESFNRADRMFSLSVSSGDIFFGPWVGVHNQYMGYEFVVKGSVHFGWARFSVGNDGAGTLTGYAYETVPGKPIVTGDTGHDEEDSVHQQGSTAAPEPPPAGLGHLALGAIGKSTR